MPAPNIQSFSRVIPMIYAYNTPGVSYHEGWTKIGYTEKQSVQQRIGQQTHTADIQWTLAWMDNAMFKDGSGQYFTDHDFHDYLQTRRQVERTAGTEWFHVDGPASQRMFIDFATHQQPKAQTRAEYTLREEQAQAVQQTKDYFEAGGTEFLWNAKPRFGKTLTAYDLIRKMGLRSVLIVTNRPSIANSWADDFQKFIAWRGEYDFVSETDALKNHPVVMSRTEHLNHALQMETQGKADPGMIAFESLQGLKGSKWFGGEYDKLKWILDNTFDLLIVDESQEGVDTLRTERAFRYIKRKHTLYLSGTPFKQLASEQFSKEQIFNWSYADEQEKKDGWAGDDYNPYEALPQLSMFTYQLSPMIYDTVQKGLDLPGEDETVDFTFDLNEFFLTNESGKFIHEAEIRKFLHALTTLEKYPFSTPELRNELRHTMWYLNRVASVKALYKLMREEEFDPIFGDYEIIPAVGDGRLGEDDDKQAAAALDRVREAIRTHEKTITLTVGQLTVGITVPEWSGVLMLCNMKSPSSYMQAAFRAQNPCIFTDENGQRFRKQNAYVFDFDPARTLIIFDEFANNLRPETAAGRGTGEDREQNIKRLLNFFPVLGEDSEGKMVELDAKAVLSIPRRLKSQEVVRRGFMSNFLFQNIGNIFGAPGIVREIVEKLTPAHEEPKRRDNGLDGLDTIQVDDQGEVEIPYERVIGKAAELFGPKIYEDMGRAVQPALDAVQGGDKGEVSRQVQNVIETMKQNLREQVFTPIGDSGEIKKGTLSRIERQAFQEVDASMEKARDDYLHEVTLAEAELAQKRRKAETETEARQAESDYQNKMQDALQAFTAGMQNTSVTKKIGNIIDLLRITAHTDALVPQDDRIHVANGTLMLDGEFLPYKDQIVRSRFPVSYNPQAGSPDRWLRFLGEVLYPEDIPTLQEFIGYCLIPSNKGQRMMIIKGNGGEGKSQIGTVISRLFGCNAKDGSVGKVSENRFARADLEHIHLMIDDDMRMEALKQTNYVKSLVTAQGKMDLEKKNKQSYQGWMYARLLAFSNGDLQALYDRSDGFYRRQLILTTREKPADRHDDPDIAQKMCDELEGIFLWAFEGLKRLAANQFRFTESARAKGNREIVRQDANNLIQFMESEGYVMFRKGLSTSSQELYRIYQIWCEENALPTLKPRSVSDFLIANQKKYGIEYTNNATNSAGRRVRGFKNIKAVIRLPMETKDGWQKVWPEDNPFEKT